MRFISPDALPADAGRQCRVPSRGMRMLMAKSRGLAAAVAVVALAVPVAGQPRSVDPRLEQAIAWYTGTAGRVDDE